LLPPTSFTFITDVIQMFQIVFSELLMLHK
jgi:hypothetical protein